MWGEHTGEQVCISSLEAAPSAVISSSEESFIWGCAVIWRTVLCRLPWDDFAKARNSEMMQLSLAWAKIMADGNFGRQEAWLCCLAGNPQQQDDDEISEEFLPL